MIIRQYMIYYGKCILKKMCIVQWVNGGCSMHDCYIITYFLFYQIVRKMY